MSFPRKPIEKPSKMRELVLEMAFQLRIKPYRRWCQNVVKRTVKWKANVNLVVTEYTFVLRMSVGRWEWPASRSCFIAMGHRETPLKDVDIFKKSSWNSFQQWHSCSRQKSFSMYVSVQSQEGGMITSVAVKVHLKGSTRRLIYNLSKTTVYTKTARNSKTARWSGETGLPTAP